MKFDIFTKLRSTVHYQRFENEVHQISKSIGFPKSQKISFKLCRFFSENVRNTFTGQIFNIGKPCEF